MYASSHNYRLQHRLETNEKRFAVMRGFHVNIIIREQIHVAYAHTDIYTIVHTRTHARTHAHTHASTHACTRARARDGSGLSPLNKCLLLY